MAALRLRSELQPRLRGNRVRRTEIAAMAVAVVARMRVEQKLRDQKLRAILTDSNFAVEIADRQ